MNDSLRPIVLVEDDPKDAELALNALAEYHVANRVRHLRDGAEALEYLYRRGQFAGNSDSPPAVILLDLKMPKMDGVEVLRQIKSEPQLKTIPVVIMTSSREDRDLERCYELGANSYVVKPVKFHEFVEAVKQLGVYWAALNEPPPSAARAESE